MAQDDSEVRAARIAAATLIQRQWRAKRRRYLSTDQRWEDALTQATFQVDRAAALDGKNSPRTRWKRAAFLAGRLRDGNRMLEESGYHADAEQKHLETQHWLELIDGKHRYGSNLKWYHKRWQAEDTSENFFKWLDKGAGKDISLDECPRSQLEKEKIKYLSAEQRLNYLVNIEFDGRLRWAKNNQLIDTTAGHWIDAGDDCGIVPRDPTCESSAEHSRARRRQTGSSPSLSNQATHYVGPRPRKYKWVRLLQRYMTPRGMMDRLLRKTVRRNTWIYVSDKNFNIFIGIKEPGTFQHSSFTSGGLVTSAGLISVKQGLIHTLSPLSGHYRTSVDHFHRFVDVLNERGVDMHKAKISKAEVALWGIERIAKIKNGKGETIQSGKDGVRQFASKFARSLGGEKGKKPQDGFRGPIKNMEST